MFCLVLEFANHLEEQVVGVGSAGVPTMTMTWLTAVIGHKKICQDLAILNMLH